MQRILAVLSVFLAQTALAHPGHGKPGLLHFHEFSDGLLLVCALAVAGLLWWARKK